MTATIREAVIGDEEILAKLNGFVQDLHVQHRPDLFKHTKLLELTAWYRTLLGNPNARCWIADDQSTPIGYLLALFQQAPENPLVQARAWCEINEIAVDPNYRKLGIARLLVVTAIAAARTEGIHRIEAASLSFNEGAHEMFRRLGFTSKIVRFELES
jgi:GNAT superfamily N-acetyltransferase